MIRFYMAYILDMDAPVHIVAVPFVHILMINTDLETGFFIYKSSSLWPWLISDVGIINWFLWSFCELRFLVLPLTYVFIFLFMLDWEYYFSTKN